MNERLEKRILEINTELDSLRSELEDCSENNYYKITQIKEKINQLCNDAENLKKLKNVVTI